MNLSGIIAVQPDDERITPLAIMGGDSFLQENWTRTLLNSIVSSEKRRRAISRAVILFDLIYGAPVHAAYALPENEALAIAYLKSDLGSKTWASIEHEAGEALIHEALEPDEALAFSVQLEKMAPISVFDWEEDVAKEMGARDFIHFVCLAVETKRQGTGVFRRLISPFLTYADEQGIPCFLESYSDDLEGLYGHFGFKTIRRYSDPHFECVERCMVRTAQRCG